MSNFIVCMPYSSLNTTPRTVLFVYIYCVLMLRYMKSFKWLYRNEIFKLTIFKKHIQYIFDDCRYYD